MSFSATHVNVTRLLGQIDTLAQLGRQPSGGVTRLTFSPEHIAATNQVAAWMDDAGLEVSCDRWGNLLGRTPGTDAAILSGSHLDSVPNGGNYDGVLGVLSALEAVRMVLDRAGSFSPGLGVVSFIEEEGARFHGLLGSSLAAGQLTADKIASIRDAGGVSFLESLASVQWPCPQRDIDFRQETAAFLELHIEQGKRLEQEGIPIGIVSSIAGPTFMQVTLRGQADHAGATAYPDRRDSLLAAAEVIMGVRALGTERFSGRAHLTVGKIQVQPNVTNVIAGQTEFSVDYRAADPASLEEITQALYALFEAVCHKNGIAWHTEIGHQSAPCVVGPTIRQVFEQATAEAGAVYQTLVSWAAHDTMNMASLADAGMVFVPCREGRSHTPEEYVQPEHIATGVAVLANAMAALAGI